MTPGSGQYTLRPKSETTVSKKLRRPEHLTGLTNFDLSQFDKTSSFCKFCESYFSLKNYFLHNVVFGYSPTTVCQY
jgi:hypothetical protein